MSNRLSPGEQMLHASFYDVLQRLLPAREFAREGLKETPKRLMKAWKEWTSGYDADIAGLMKQFNDGAENYDEMVCVAGIPFYSHCEHHLAPFFGTATIAYLPDKRIVGLSKLPRLLNVFAKRLQVQERLTVQVADTLMNYLEPRGVAVSVRARHLCMESRGVASHGPSQFTTTTALRGAFLEPGPRAEFLHLCNGVQYER